MDFCVFVQCIIEHLIVVKCCNKCLMSFETFWHEVKPFALWLFTVSGGAALIPSLPLPRIGFMDH